MYSFTTQMYLFLIGYVNSEFEMTHAWFTLTFKTQLSIVMLSILKVTRTKALLGLGSGNALHPKLGATTMQM